MLTLLQLLDAFNDLDSVEAHRDAEVLLKVRVTHELHELSIDSNLFELLGVLC